MKTCLYDLPVQLAFYFLHILLVLPQETDLIGFGVNNINSFLLCQNSIDNSAL
jgi:hypothetical protein